MKRSITLLALVSVLFFAGCGGSSGGGGGSSNEETATVTNGGDTNGNTTNDTATQNGDGARSDTPYVANGHPTSTPYGISEELGTPPPIPE